MKQAYILVVILIGFSFIAALPPDCRGTVVFEDDFESYEVGGEPTPTWRSFNDGPEATSIVVDSATADGSGQALELSTPTNYDGVNIETDFETISTSARLKFDLYQIALSENFLLFTVMEPTDGTFRESVAFQIYDGILSISDFSSVTPGDVECALVTTQTWHEIQIELQFGENPTIGIKLDGEALPDCTDIAITPMKDLGIFYFVSAGAGAVNYIDNVRVVRFDENEAGENQ
ncbi:hypothetical protein KDL45_11090 [bacterium]|nr:hypothetical protein [bacterium]